MKRLYKGSFNHQGEIHILYRNARWSGQAKGFMLKALAEKLRVSFSSLRSYFSGRKDNFLVKHYRGEEE